MKSLITKRLSAFLLLVAFVVTTTFAPVTASAQIINSDYQPRTVDELIAYLYGLIASLEAQKDGGTVLPGGSSSNNVNRAQVETLSATNIKKNSVTVRSNIDFGTASYVYSYFEYGTKNTVEEMTDEKKFNKTSRKTNAVVLDDLRSNTTYYYRAVIELPSGVKLNGALRKFTTGKSTSSSSSNNGDDEVTTDESEYEQGDEITVTYEYPGDRDSGSWIGLYEEGDDDDEYISWKYLYDDDGEVEFYAPDEDGEYEFRLFKDSGYDEVATSDTFEVN